MRKSITMLLPHKIDCEHYDGPMKDLNNKQ